MTTAEIIARDRATLAAAEAELIELLANDGDIYVNCFAKHPPFDHEPTMPRAVAAARVGFLRELVRRHECRS